MKTILVTGGNRGIGFQVCKELVNQGHRVILTARKNGEGLKAARELQGEVLFHTLDVSDQKSIDELAHFIDKEIGTLDVLINNAAVIDSKGLTEVDVDEVRKLMDINFYGPMRLNKALQPFLERSSEGRIINVSSGMGVMTEFGTGYAGYRLSKAGLNAQTILLSNELSEMGIKVNAVCPGWVRTEMGGVSAPRSIEKGAETIVWLALGNTIPNGKFFRDKRVIDW